MRKVTENKSLKFNDISAELYRVYHFPNGEAVRIDMPQSLNVSKSGGHRVMDDAGISHYIPGGWIHLVWENKADLPAFQF
jgi:hypothetical protein